jgi:hypothetical protein
MSTQIPSQRNRSAAVGRNQRGEDKVGKTNLVFALRLILDPSLPERDRQVGLEHFRDGLGDQKLRATIETAIELTDFCDDPRLLAHLADCAAYQETTPITMGLAPTRIDALIRTLRLLIDSGTRGINEASLGTANPIF